METAIATSNQESIRDKDGRFKKGCSGNPFGVPKGIKQKAVLIREAFYDAFDKTGGIDELVKWIKKDKFSRREFYKMILNALPKEIEIDGEGFNNTKIVILRDGSQTKEVPGQVCVQSSEIPSDGKLLGNRQEYVSHIASNVIQRADTKQSGNSVP